jgi:adenine-specific DNA-methyltransferase
MASQARTYDKKKLLGQIYTPLHIVEKILGLTGFYTAFDGKKILDPACGDGRFLVPAAQFIIDHSLPEQLECNLNQIHGWDIDQNALDICRQNLDKLLERIDVRIEWNLYKIDALKQLNQPEKFDLIIGNPPYIRIQHLPDLQRKYIQKTYSFCTTGATDAYVAFFQLASSLLSENGICGFITPNSYFTSVTGSSLRLFFQTEQNLTHITNFGTIQIFENTGTYTAITVFGRQKRQHFHFEKYESNYSSSGRDIGFNDLSAHFPWQLSVTPNTISEGIKLGDLCRISVGLTTLADRFYLFSVLSEDGNLVEAINKNGLICWLEKELLKPIVKGSKLKSENDPIQEHILFPYQKDGSGKHKIIPEDVLAGQFPETYKYLLSVRSELDHRDNGKRNAVSWYAFGRAQGLDQSFGKKIIFSPMNISPNFILYENPESTVYSGYFIKYDGDYEQLLRQLNSSRMAEYIQSAGRDFQGGYKGYNKKILENFIITS